MATLLAFLIMLPILSPAFSGNVEAASAADACQGDFGFPDWNETIQRQAKVPIEGYMGWDEFEDERPRRADEGPRNDDSENNESNTVSSWEEYEGPEEPWMESNSGNTEFLTPIRDDTRLPMLVGNDAVGSLRVNLDPTARTTVCVTIESIGEEETNLNPRADVYLLTTSQWDRYTSSYDARHGAWWAGLGLGGELDTSETSPEWRSFNILGWRSYRDSHQYEDITEVSFSVSLDGPESYSGLFGGDEIEYFHIVVDNTNNSHGNDAIPDSTILATVSIVTEDRGTILPAWTVSLTCMVFMFGTLAIPIIMNKRYMGSGLDLTTADNQVSVTGLVPSLEQQKPDDLGKGPD